MSFASGGSVNWIRRRVPSSIDWYQRLELGKFQMPGLGGLLRSSTGMHSSSKALLLNLAIWLNGRVSPRPARVEAHPLPLQKVITDLLDTFDLHCGRTNPGHDDPWLRTVMFYKDCSGWRPGGCAEAGVAGTHYYWRFINSRRQLAL